GPSSLSRPGKSHPDRRIVMKNHYLLWAAWAPLAICVPRAAPPPYFVTHVAVYELPTLGGKQPVARDINDKGEVVGWSVTVNGVKHTFLYSAGVMEDITFGTFSQAEAHGINNYTQVVGITGAPEEQM